MAAMPAVSDMAALLAQASSASRAKQQHQPQQHQQHQQLQQQLLPQPQAQERQQPGPQQPQPDEQASERGCQQHHAAAGTPAQQAHQQVGVNLQMPGAVHSLQHQEPAPVLQGRYVHAGQQQQQPPAAKARNKRKAIVSDETDPPHVLVADKPAGSDLPSADCAAEPAAPATRLPAIKRRKLHPLAASQAAGSTGSGSTQQQDRQQHTPKQQAPTEKQQPPRHKLPSSTAAGASGSVGVASGRAAGCCGGCHRPCQPASMQHRTRAGLPQGSSRCTRLTVGSKTPKQVHNQVKTAPAGQQPVRQQHQQQPQRSVLAQPQPALHNEQQQQHPPRRSVVAKRQPALHKEQQQQPPQRSVPAQLQPALHRDKEQQQQQQPQRSVLAQLQPALHKEEQQQQQQQQQQPPQRSVPAQLQPALHKEQQQQPPQRSVLAQLQPTLHKEQQQQQPPALGAKALPGRAPAPGAQAAAAGQAPQAHSTTTQVTEALTGPVPDLLQLLCDQGLKPHEQRNGVPPAVVEKGRQFRAPVYVVLKDRDRDWGWGAATTSEEATAAAVREAVASLRGAGRLPAQLPSGSDGVRKPQSGTNSSVGGLQPLQDTPQVAQVVDSKQQQQEKKEDKRDEQQPVDGVAMRQGRVLQHVWQRAKPLPNTQGRSQPSQGKGAGSSSGLLTGRHQGQAEVRCVSFTRLLSAVVAAFLLLRVPQAVLTVNCCCLDQQDPGSTAPCSPCTPSRFLTC